MTPLDRAVGVIKAKGSARTPDIAAVLAMDPDQIDKLLAGPLERGFLIGCDVQVGDAKVKEYRCTLNGGGKLNDALTPGPKPAKAPDPFKERLREWRAPKVQPSADEVSTGNHQSPTAQPAPAAPRSAEASQENTMSIREKIEKLLTQHGPMTSRQLRKHGLKDDTLAQHLSDLADREVLQRMGGGTRSTIYGIAQKKGEANDETPPRQRVALAAGGELGRRKPDEEFPFSGLLTALKKKHAALLVEVTKVEAAIGAVEALG